MKSFTIKIIFFPKNYRKVNNSNQRGRKTVEGVRDSADEKT